MNLQEKVATLEALLARVKQNAAKPRTKPTRDVAIAAAPVADVARAPSPRASSPDIAKPAAPPRPQSSPDLAAARVAARAPSSPEIARPPRAPSSPEIAPTEPIAAKAPAPPQPPVERETRPSEVPVPLSERFRQRMVSPAAGAAPKRTPSTATMAAQKAAMANAAKAPATQRPDSIRLGGGGKPPFSIHDEPTATGDSSPTSQESAKPERAAAAPPRAEAPRPAPPRAAQRTLMGVGLEDRKALDQLIKETENPLASTLIADGAPPQPVPPQAKPPAALESTLVAEAPAMPKAPRPPAPSPFEKTLAMAAPDLDETRSWRAPQELVQGTKPGADIHDDETRPGDPDAIAAAADEEAATVVREAPPSTERRAPDLAEHGPKVEVREPAAKMPASFESTLVSEAPPQEPAPAAAAPRLADLTKTMPLSPPPELAAVAPAKPTEVEPPAAPPKTSEPEVVAPSPAIVAVPAPSVDVAPVAQVATPAPKVEPIAPLPTRQSEVTTQPSIRRPEKKGAGVGLYLAAFVVVGAGVFIALRNGWLDQLVGPTTQPSAVTTSAPTVTSTTSASPTPRPPVPPLVPPTTQPTASAAPNGTAAPTASATASAAPSTTAAPTTAPSTTPTTAPSTTPTSQTSTADASSLAPGRALLTVNFGQPGTVFVNGVLVGKIGDRNEVDCGAKFVRLGAPDAQRGKTPVWIAEGRSLQIPCKVHTTLAYQPPPPGGQAPSGGSSPYP